MKSALRILPFLPALASANTTLGFEEFTGYTPPNEVPVAFVGQPYSNYITLTVNNPYYVYKFGGFAPEGSNFISGGPATSYDVTAVSGVSLHGVSLHGFEGNQQNVGPWPSGTVMAYIRLYSGSSLVQTINIDTSAAGHATSYVFSSYTASDITRFVILDSATPDTYGFAVDAIILSGSSNGGGGGVVPEPSTYGLALGGLALVAVALRRRNKVSK